MGLGAMGSTDFTKLLFLLSIAQRLEWRGQTQKDGGSNPTKVKFTTYERKTNRINILLIVHHLLVGNRFGPTIVRTKEEKTVQNISTQANLLGERLESLDKNLSSCGLPPPPGPEATGTT